MVLADTLSRGYLTTESRSGTVENGLEILNTQSTFEKKLEQNCSCRLLLHYNKQVTRDSARNSS